MNNTLSRIVSDDQAITETLEGPEGVRLQRLVDLYRTSGDRDAFVYTLAARTMLEHQQRKMAIQRSMEAVPH